MGTKKETIFLGLETSCDDTGVALVTSGKRILANQVYNQHTEHTPYGGIVPEIAARAHVEHIDGLIRETLKEAGIRLADIDAIAATAGPGLIGGLMVGLVTAKTLALTLNKPFVAINHLEGHALSARLVKDIPFPYLLLLISGGHCQLISVEGVGKYTRLGTTIDDAAGEAFDKAAKLLGLGVPGGPAVEKVAQSGNPERFSLPRPLAGKPGCDFSFSGLKTALLYTARELTPLSDADVQDLAASYQAAIADCLFDRSSNACAIFRDRNPDAKNPDTRKPVFVMAGGVAANRLIRERLEELCDDKEFEFFAPPSWLCTDNGAMIAWAGQERFKLGQKDVFDFPARARWPLDEDATPKVGYGKKGAKV